MNMTGISDHKRQVQTQFGDTAANYVTSPGHARGDDLADLAAWAAPLGGADRRALDTATGGGHTARAIAAHYGQVIASDLTYQMLATAADFIRSQGVANVRYSCADAEQLPFKDGAFDLVTCRIAPHHFDDVTRFVREVARVLQPGGHFLLIDNLAPDDPDLGAFLNRVEALRDPTHVRVLSQTEWRDLVTNAGLIVEDTLIHPKTHPFTSWLDRANVPASQRPVVEAALRDASPAARAAFTITSDNVGQITSYSAHSLLLKARKVMSDE
jgi:ubiquinone/menaquinone biosynthesis C-methylase UbiE